ncbi:class I SAM-dependent methyltransferase [Photobacterium sagamiensis]|uniref:class I SAM-dependent methyltransferase n=1 Tax=Photobacterium sagamiensis TaxID=2910241 RepID=UPI003D0F3F51
MSVEFGEVRSKSYQSAISQFPGVWDEDMQIMHQYLSPKEGDVVAELGAGSGFFSFAILDGVKNSGQLHVIDPSKAQLAPLFAVDAQNLTISCTTAEDAAFTSDTSFDLIWSRGAFHHVADKTAVMSKLSRHSKPGSKCIIFDIFSGSTTAKFFDDFVAKACTTGHEVSFLSKEFAKSLCLNSGWGAPELIDIPLKWKFKTESDIGKFIGLLLSNKPGVSVDDTLKNAKEILGIEKHADGVYLNWPMTLMIAEKGS